MEKGTICPALIKEDYEYHLSGDAAKFCICTLNNEACKGRVISDPDNLSSQFFSRGKCSIDMEEIKKCPVYGCSASILKLILKEKLEKEMNDKLNSIE
jgi:hypothetical protein